MGDRFYVHPKTGDRRKAGLRTAQSVLLTMGYEEIDPEQAQAMILAEVVPKVTGMLEDVKSALEAGDLSLAAQEARRASNCLNYGGESVFNELKRHY